MVGWRTCPANFGGGEPNGNSEESVVVKLEKNYRCVGVEQFCISTATITGPTRWPWVLDTVGGTDAYRARFDTNGNNPGSKWLGDAQDEWIDEITMDADDDRFGTDEGDCNDADPETYPGALRSAMEKNNACDGYRVFLHSRMLWQVRIMAGPSQNP